MEEVMFENIDSCKPHCNGIDVPTEKEIAILMDMKKVKERVRKIKGRLSQISSSKENEEAGRLKREMKALKNKWSGLDERRKAAAHERMVILGHEEPRET